MASPIDGLKPELLWKHFYQLTQTPRPSKKEEKVRALLRKTITAMGLPFSEDAVGNIVARKPASKGFENAPSILLQGHVDMVCEKNKGAGIDFDNDPLNVYRDGEWIRAKETTLGADNGIGVAAALAVMEDHSLEHGPLEFLFTIDEETGLTGANALQPGFLASSTMLNLDSEEEGALYVGCSGGKDTEARLPLAYENAPAGSTGIELTVTGLRGGHSGLDIHLGRGNALKLLARTIAALSNSFDIGVAGMEGGSKRNAIPREAEAILTAPKKQMGEIVRAIAELQAEYRAEFGQVEPGLAVAAKETAAPKKIIGKNQKERLIDLLASLPHGVIKMSADIPGLVETSTNLATVTCAEEVCVIGTSQRSSVASEKEDIVAQTAAVCRLAGFAVSHGDGYPGWKPNLSSRALRVTKQTYAELYGKEPEVKAIHAGLECGIIGEKFPAMDMLSFGPTIEGAHSPDERVNVRSVEEFWKLLLGVLKNLGKSPAV